MSTLRVDVASERELLNAAIDGLRATAEAATRRLQRVEAQLEAQALHMDAQRINADLRVIAATGIREALRDAVQDAMHNIVREATVSCVRRLTNSSVADAWRPVAPLPPRRCMTT
eukprot:NODE_28409_length_478_cov_0.923077.p3 GENE.NODE_28409_length_478_cov_0.923077~~NODE_28409_length_478_cov_0.923077.p3  ORF type:complete len:115 (-),score=31.71 NODE_28409_length_478_cov_0.923077:36-380(-)